jgi:uncharacterized protein involved in response to NO
MALVTLSLTPLKQTFWTQGFRPFFLGAGSFAILSVILWLGLYGLHWQLLPPHYPPLWWHMHEMIFGYTLAVIAGFLLTAVKNWTQITPAPPIILKVLVVLWLVARLLPFSPLPNYLVALADLSFDLLLVILIGKSLLKAKNYKQLPILGFLSALTLTNGFFYLGLLGYNANGLLIGLYLGFYIILGLLMVMGRRVIPYFIEHGVNTPFKATQYHWLDILIIITFIMFVVSEMIGFSTQNNTAQTFSGILAVIQALLHGFRLWGWYHPNIWGMPLLWSLVLGYGWISVGFLLKYFHVVADVPYSQSIHAFAYGALAMITVSMMSRVALGHSGRNVNNPPSLLRVIFILLFAGAFIRVFYTWIVPEYYELWIILSQSIWILAFTAWTITYFPIFTKPSQ